VQYGVQFHSPQGRGRKNAGRTVVGPPRHGKLSICSARPCVAPKRALIDRTPRFIPQPQRDPLGLSITDPDKPFYSLRHSGITDLRVARTANGEIAVKSDIER
jgi:hypothetical protein